MITQLTLGQVIVDWLESTTGIKYAFASQDSARLRSQYGTIRLIKKRKRAIPEMTVTDINGDDTKLDEKIRIWYQTTFSVIVYKDTDNFSALDIVDLIALNIQTSNAEEYFSVNGMGLSNLSNSRGFDVLAKNVMEPRANIDLEFNVHQELVTVIDNIEGVSIENSLLSTINEPLTQTTLTKRTI